MLKNNLIWYGIGILYMYGIVWYGIVQYWYGIDMVLCGVV